EDGRGGDRRPPPARGGLRGRLRRHPAEPALPGRHGAALRPCETIPPRQAAFGRRHHRDGARDHGRAGDAKAAGGSVTPRREEDQAMGGSGYGVEPIGYVRSSLTSLDAAPLQGDEGAPEAWLELESSMTQGLRGIAIGDRLVVLTWLHRSRRDVLEVHP